MHMFLKSRIASRKLVLSIYRLSLDSSLSADVNESLQFCHHILTLLGLFGALCHDRCRRFQGQNSICSHLLSQQVSYTIVCKTCYSMAKVILNTTQKPFKG